MSNYAAILWAFGFGLATTGFMTRTNADEYYATINDIRKIEGRESLAEYARQRRDRTRWHPSVSIGARRALKKYNL
jgi:hypothetical protein